MKRKLVFYFFISINLICFAENFILLEDEVIYNIDFMSKGDLPENFEEYTNIIKKENQFLSNCEVISEDKNLIGKWILVDGSGNLQKKSSFNICEITNISLYENYLVFDNFGNRSYIYKNNNRYYIYTRWMNIIRMIQVKDNEMFVYIIDSDKWILDPIHENGKYFFIKE